MLKSDVGQSSKQSGVTTIALRLLNSGKYVWTIESTFDTQEKDDAIKIIKELDARIKDTFPNFPSPGSGRTMSLDEE